MKNFLMILMIVASSFIPFIAFAQANFVRDLFAGISGSDVFDLQKILNSDSETKIAESGSGAPGNETTYFGNLTKIAVQKFQIKYSDYVLKPVGLAVPTGYVGVFTRDFLNKSFLNKQNSETSTVVTQNSNETLENKAVVTDKPVIGSVSPETVSGKTKITILGKNFTDKNTIIITLESRTAFENIKSTDSGTKIEFEFESSIQKTFDAKYLKISKKAKQKVLEMFPKYKLAVSVITNKGQSNFKTITFNLK
jgi:hypothetical protein